jgi:hypothetical protein
VIPESHGIGGNSFRPHPPVGLCACRLIVGICEQFPIAIPELDEILRGSKELKLTSSGIDRTDFGCRNGSVMFNIAK